MKPPPEDGSLKEITSSGLIQEINVIVIQRPNEIKEPGETTYTLATFDRTKEGEEWPGDQVLEKLIPGLPKVKSPEVSKPEVTVKTNNVLKNRIRKKCSQKSWRKDSNFTATHQQKPPYKKYRPERSGNPVLTKNIQPWVQNPWETQTFFSERNNVKPVNAISLNPEIPLNNFQSQPFPPRTSGNKFNFPNNSGYERNMRPIRAPNIPFLNNQTSLPRNRMPSVPLPSFQPPIRYTWPSNGEFSAPYPAPNINYNGLTKNIGLLGESPIPRCNVKQGLLGDRPPPNMSFNTTIEEENISNQNCFISNAKNCSIPVKSYDASYGRISRPNFDNYIDDNEISMQDSCDSYIHQLPNSTDESRNESFRDTGEASYTRFLNSSNSVNSYENQYQDGYKHLNRIYPNNNDKNIISLKNPRDSWNDNICKNNYNESQISNIHDTSSINNQGQIPMEGPFIHVNDSGAAFSQKDFQHDGYPASAVNSIPRSNLNLEVRSNRRNNHNKGTKKRGQWKGYKDSNNRLKGMKNYRGQQRFRNWRTSRK